MQIRIAVLALCGALCTGLLPACGGGGGDDSGQQGGNPQAAPLEADPLDFGSVVIGDAVARVVVVRNPVDGERVDVTQIQIDGAGYEFDNDFPALPARLDPGSSLVFTVRARPDVPGDRDATLSVIADDPLDPLEVALSCSGLPSEQTIDFGAQALSPANETQELAVVVPANAVSLTIEAYGDVANTGPIFLSQLTGPGNVVYVDPADPHAGPYIFARNFPSQFFSVPVLPLHDTRFMLPNTDNPQAQLVLGGGTYRFRITATSPAISSVNVRVHLEMRTSSNLAEGHVDLNVFLAAGVPVTTLQAPTNAALQEALGEAQRSLSQVGLEFGTVTYHKLTNPAFDTLTGNDTGPLFQLSQGAPPSAANVFVVASIPFGVSGAIPGSKRHGTPYSGIVVPFPGAATPKSIGLTIAHELSHYLGLGHTFENPGLPWTHDLILDTINCGFAGCDDNLMDAIFVGTKLTAGQAHVLLRHYLVQPGPGTFVPGVTLSPQLAGTDAPLPCGTCGR